MSPQQESTLTSAKPDTSVRPRQLAYVLMSVGTSALLLLYVVIPARSLEPGEYSRFASLFSVVVLLGVIFTAVQTYVAGSLIRAGADGRAAALWAIRTRVARWCVILAGALALAAPILSSALRTSLFSVLLVGLLSTLTLVWASLLGVLQGDQRFVALGAVNATQAVLRLLAVAAVISFQSVDLILAATVVSMLPALALVVTVAGPFESAGRGTELDGIFALPRSLPAFVVAFVVGFPTVGDVVVARVSLTAEAAGDIAVISIVGRVTVFFAAMIAVVAYPRFAEAEHDPNGHVLLLRVTGVIAAVAIPITAVAIWQRALTLTLLSGDARPAALSLLPWYLVASLLFALAIPGCYYQLARTHRRRGTAILLPPVIAMIAFGLVVDDPATFVMGLVAASALLAVTVAVAVAVTVVGGRQP